MKLRTGMGGGVRGGGGGGARVCEEGHPLCDVGQLLPQLQVLLRRGQGVGGPLGRPLAELGAYDQDGAVLDEEEIARLAVGFGQFGSMSPAGNRNIEPPGSRTKVKKAPSISFGAKMPSARIGRS